LETEKTNGREIVQFATGQNNGLPEVVPAPFLLSLTTFTNHVEILNRCKPVEERVFYILYAYRERLNYKELKRSIKTDAFAALAAKKHGISKRMLSEYPDSSVLFKDELFVDFLALPTKHSENKLRSGILSNMKNFILEIGKDFLFVDSEYCVNVGGSTFKIDLLFFHRGLQCLVAIELKAGEFRPKDLGQLEFYLEALDRDVKRSNENPSIGILLCQSANKSVVEYALSRSLSPTMVAKYRRHLIPKETLRKSLDEAAFSFEQSSVAEKEDVG
jgi:predicted nuclease of restriction endonuclease-like (RecB) superfamily